MTNRYSSAEYSSQMVRQGQEWTFNTGSTLPVREPGMLIMHSLKFFS